MKGKLKNKVESLTSWLFFINSNKYELLLKSKGYNKKEKNLISVKSLAFIAVDFVPDQRLSEFLGEGVGGWRYSL